MTDYARDPNALSVRDQLAFEPLGYLPDDGVATWPQRWIAGIDLADAAVQWCDPLLPTISTTSRWANLETLEVMTGAALVELCDRLIPTRGQE